MLRSIRVTYGFIKPWQGTRRVQVESLYRPYSTKDISERSISLLNNISNVSKANDPSSQKTDNSEPDNKEIEEAKEATTSPMENQPPITAEVLVKEHTPSMSINENENFGKDNEETLEFQNDIVKFLETFEEDKSEIRMHDLDKITNITAKHLEESTLANEDFVDSIEELKKKRDDRDHKQEKSLFLDVFNNFMNDNFSEEFDSKKLQDDISSLSYQRSKTQNKIEEIISRVAPLPKTFQFTSKLFQDTEKALSPTINAIENEFPVPDLIQYFHDIKKNWAKLASEKSAEFYMTNVINLDNNTSVLNSIFTEIENKSKLTPKNFQVNLLTLPVVCNKIVNVLAVKYNEPQLAKTVFKDITKDVKFSAVACSQQIYNEILRITWVFNGKTSLGEILEIYNEMIKSGFNGDLVTFNIIKKILIDYTRMKNGMNPDGTQSIAYFSKEMDKKASILENKLRAYSQSEF